MFVGHLAVALGAKRVEPRLPLVALTSAAFGLDMIWPFLVLGGIETVRIDPGNTAFTPLDFSSYPWSHSLVMSLVWGGLAGFAASRALKAKAPRAGLVIAALVVSHWVLDVVTHRPDMPIWPDGPKVGLGLWNSIPATLAVEAAMLLTGAAIYIRTAPARDRIGRWAFVALILLVGAMWASGPFSPPPPSATAIGIVGIAFPMLVVPWTMWIERHRG